MSSFSVIVCFLRRRTHEESFLKALLMNLCVKNDQYSLSIKNHVIEKLQWITTKNSENKNLKISRLSIFLKIYQKVYNGQAAK